MSEIIEVIVTSPVEWMPQFVESAIEDRLIACAHQVTIDTSYTWDGQFRRTQEIRAAMHTTKARQGELLARIEKDHPFEVPCVLVMTAIAAESYGGWVAEATSNPNQRRDS